jgi:uncharacterized repeat protein (TIGR01451 family)
MLLLSALLCFSNPAIAQARQAAGAVSEEEYQQLKEGGMLPQPAQVAAPKSLRPENIILPVEKVTSNGLLVPLDPSFSVVPFTNGDPPEYRNDDGFTDPVPLSFTFTFYGNQYTQIYINNNGNLSFEGSYSSFTPSGFPIADFAMIAPFWGDVDTRNLSSGVVYYKSEPNRIIVIWDSVGYYSQHADKVNTFEVIITDGTDPLIGVGNNVCFSFGDMQWTTGDASGGSGGFGGAPAAVGTNKGDGVNYALVGRFDHEGVDYDGPGGNPDGVSYLDNKDFCFNVAEGAGSIAGTNFLDSNGNGVQDPGEAGLPGWTIRLDPGPIFTTTDANGDYFFSFLPPNTYTVSEILKPNWAQTYPAPPGTHTLVVDSGQTVLDIDFGNQPLANVQDLSVSVAGGVARPGFQKFYGIVYQNKGTIDVAGIVTFNLPPELDYLDSSPGGAYNAGTHTVTWNAGNLVAGFVGWLWVKTQIPASLALGTALTSSALIEPVAGDTNPADNSDSETQIVRSSFDPNDKLVNPVGSGPTGIIAPDQTLTYMVRFQNTGTDTALTVVVRDLLDIDLDLSSVEIGASSHPFTFGIVEPRELVWTFNNLLLPDSTTNESESHGFVKFTVKPRADVEPGVFIENSAAIYFDFNAPVLTNIVSNQIANNVGNINSSPTSHNFGEVDIGLNLSHTFVISNEETQFGNLNVTSTTITGAHVNQFAIISGGAPFTLGPNESRNLVVRFQPTTLGAKNATLMIYSNDPDENPLEVPLSGTGTGTAYPSINVEQFFYSFGKVLVGLSGQQTVVVGNAATAAANLVVDSIGVSGKNEEQFNVISGGAPFTLAPGASRNVVLRFTPATIGTQNATLKIYSNDPNSLITDVTMQGDGGLDAKTSVFQNPAATKYADLVVTSNVYLSTVPTVRAWVNTDTTTVPMTLIPGNGKIYSGSYMFTENGFYSISTDLTIEEFDTMMVRTFGVTLVKPGIDKTVLALNSKAALRIGRDDLREETYFIADFEEKGRETVYQFAPLKTFDQPLELELSYDETAHSDPGKLFIYQKQGDVWVQLNSQVFSNRQTVRAFVNTLGGFKIGYDTDFSGSNLVPTELTLKQNYPNPFNPATTIEFDLPEDGNISLVIYNMLGQKVRTLYSGHQLAGTHRLQWDAADDRASHLASGVYFYHLQAGDLVQTRKMLLLR